MGFEALNEAYKLVSKNNRVKNL